jgi:hypothetical protein
MNLNTRVKHTGLLVVIALVVLVSVSPLYAHPSGLPEPSPSEFGNGLRPQPFRSSSMLKLDIDVTGELVPGVLGLPGEPVTWVITVKNAGQVAGQDVIVTDTVHDA